MALQPSQLSRGGRTTEDHPVRLHPRLHCLFYQHDKQSCNLYKSHPAPGFTDIARVHEHLKRRHKSALSSKQCEAISSTIQRHPKKQLAQKWKAIYKLIFPNEDIPPPFHPTLEQHLVAARQPSSAYLTKVGELISADGALPPDTDQEQFARFVLRSFYCCAVALSETGDKCLDSAQIDNPPTPDLSCVGNWQDMHMMMSDSFFDNAFHGPQGGTQ